MTGYNDCPYRKNIDCLYKGAIIFCKNCGFYPPEEKRRKSTLEKYSDEISTERQKNIVQLNIKHHKKKVTYTIRRVRKRTSSPKTDKVSNNQHGVGSKTRPDQTGPDQTRPDQTNEVL